MTSRACWGHEKDNKHLSAMTSAELNALTAAAARGPWVLVENDNMKFQGFSSYVINTDDLPIVVTTTYATATFIAATRQAIPQLLAEIAQLHAQLERSGSS